MLSAQLIYAADFSPTPMKLTTPPQLAYNFNGSNIDIPFTLTGTSAAIWLVINTNGQADNIKAVRNGYLGWHYVNKIDTTIYISGKYEKDSGTNTITWDGKDENGNKASAGAYDYYLWGYDNKSDRQKVCDYIMIGYNNESQFNNIYELGEDSLPLSRPFIMGAVTWMFSDSTKVWKNHGIHYKWQIGNNPDDVSLLQTTKCGIYKPWYLDPKWHSAYMEYDYGGPVLDPDDYNVFYHCCVNIPNLTETMLKWKFVSGGEAILDNDWLGWENLTWTDGGMGVGSSSQRPSCYTDRNYIYVVSPGQMAIDEWNKLRCVSFDGEVKFDKMMHDWYMPDDPGNGNFPNGAFNKLYSRGGNKWFLLGTICCLQQMIDTSRLLDDPDNENDMVVFENRNGDYFLDSNSAPNIEPAWACITWDSDTSVWRNSICIDSNNFNLIFFGFGGISSFGVMTQDGSGIGELAFGDDSAVSNKRKDGGQLCDNGSSYDGLYMNGAWTSTTSDSWQLAQTYYVAFDSAKGVISDKPLSVEEQKPFQFKVNQNSPNPFNPSTTISFTTPESGNVSVEIYNVAGQKVQTLVNSYMIAGEHSVKWDAKGFSAGVYFYKIKAGKYEKTMKMTLLK